MPGRSISSVRLVAIGLLVLALPSPARASMEWQVRPFIGVTFGGGTTLVDPERAAGHPNVVVGVSGQLLGEILGVDVDLGQAPGFFDRGNLNLVTGSAVTTLSGNVVVGVPRSRTVYTLRPYLLGGLGVMHARIDDFFAALPITMNRPAVDFGGGVSGMLSNRVGLSWELRYFRSVGGRDRGLSIGPERLSFFRANMAVVIKL